MQRFIATCAVIGALGLAACGSPSELDEAAFPALNDTGYASNGTTDVSAGNQAGSTGVASGGSGGTSSNAGGTQAGGSSASAGSGSTVETPGGCPSDITVLFNRPITEGGCTSGGGCHEANGLSKPDLVSPNVASRLLNMPSTCSKTSSGMSVGPRPYISKDDSFLEEKIAGSPGCGAAMPFFMPQALSEADRQCILDWISQVSGG